MQRYSEEILKSYHPICSYVARVRRNIKRGRNSTEYCGPINSLNAKCRYSIESRSPILARTTILYFRYKCLFPRNVVATRRTGINLAWSEKNRECLTLSWSTAQSPNYRETAESSTMSSRALLGATAVNDASLVEQRTFGSRNFH